MVDSYIKLGIATLFPVIASILFFLLEEKTGFKKLNFWYRQIIIGLIFGAIAIIGTEWGIPIEGAMVNCRDAAPLCAGLLFGGPAGIIAGVIGGVERWIAVAWGVGTFTRVACSVSTIAAGLYAAALRKFFFDDKRPGWIMAMTVGFVMEIFHLTMVFITNLDQTEKAASVVKACSIPMVVANAFSVMLATLLITVIAKNRLMGDGKGVRISQTIQRWLLLCVTVTFFLTSGFMYALQKNIEHTDTRTTLRLSIEDVEANIHEASDNNMLATCHKIAKIVNMTNLNMIRQMYGVSEVSIIDDKGIIAASTYDSFVGFDMSSGEQSAAFLPLLDRVDEMVQPYGPISYDETLYRKYAGVALENGGFVQIGYSASKFQQELRKQIQSIVANRHVGEEGFIIILNNKGGIESAPTHIASALTETVQGLKGKGFYDKKMEVFNMSISGEDYYGMYDVSEGYSILSVIPNEETSKSITLSLYVNTFMEVLIFALMFALIYLLVRKVVVKNIHSVNDTLSLITSGDLDQKVNVRSNEEFDVLSNDINSTVDRLKEYIAEAAARIDKELEFAKNIQMSSLPQVTPIFSKNRSFSLYARMDTAKEVGGDFYDFYMLDKKYLNFLIADVSGKGIPAAMFMMRSKTQLKSLTETGLPLDETFRMGNNDLCEGNDAGMFVTAWMGNMDMENGKVEFVNAGHNAPVIGHADGTYEYLKSKAGFVLAGMEDYPYKKQEIVLQQGDVIFLYTDGITEATDINNELYGEDRLITFLNSMGAVSDMKLLCDAVKEDVDKFVGEAPQFDDMSMLAVRYTGCGQVKDGIDE